jgi:flagellar hook-length control protein FliK
MVAAAIGLQASPSSKLAAPGSAVASLAGVGALSATLGTAAASSLPGAAPGANAVPATPDGLAAAITAMQQSGQTNAVLQLDPAGLGAVSVHVALGHNAQINVQFVPAVAQTAQLLNNGLDGLRQAMAASGLTLGQVQVGGGQTNGERRDGGRQSSSSRTVAGTTTTASPDKGPDGIRAYA